jgi:hypothetical protein
MLGLRRYDERASRNRDIGLFWISVLSQSRLPDPICPNASLAIETDLGVGWPLPCGTSVTITRTRRFRAPATGLGLERLLAAVLSDVFHILH